MKLIDCLLEVLPSHGGWKPGADFVAVSFGEAKFYSEKGGWLSTIDGVVDGMEGMKVNREEYELALAKSNRPAWSGEGLPPVGSECEVKGAHGDESWSVGKILSHTNFKGRNCAVFQTEETVSVSSSEYFRPIRTDAERKREETIADLQNALGHAHGLFDLVFLYKALTSGSIRHITLK